MSDWIEKSLSKARLEYYSMFVASTGSDTDWPELRRKAFQLHEWNSKLSEAMYRPLQFFEITIRNVLADKLKDEYGPYWYTSSDWKSAKIQRFVKAAAKRAKDYQHSRNIKHDAIVSNSNFALWIKLLNPRDSWDLWNKHWSKILVSNGVIEEGQRYTNHVNEIFEVTIAVSELRNLILHYQPIFDLQEVYKNSNNKKYKALSLKTLPKHFEELTIVLGWFSPKARNHIEDQYLATVRDVWIKECPEWYEQYRKGNFEFRSRPENSNTI